MATLSLPRPRWRECIVAASGPSLTPEVAELCQRSGLPIVAVSDAYKLFPDAEILYSCDADWWFVHNGCPGFAGEKWSSHGDEKENNKAEAQQRCGLKLIQGKQADGFSLNPSFIHYGCTSGFQAINLAILFGAKRIVLVGFNMQAVGRRSHFFGDHPPSLRHGDLRTFLPWFDTAAQRLPPDIEIINATPDSALRSFKMMRLEDALSD
jgi:hypothetical protein